MKKTLILLLVCSLMLSLTGCIGGSRANRLTREVRSENKAKEQLFETVLTALKTEDSDLLKSVFSQKALDEATDIDEGIEYTFDFFEGEVLEYKDCLGFSSSYNEYGKKKATIQIEYKITTDVGEYYLTMYYFWKNDFDKDKEGVYSFSLTDYSEYEDKAENRYISGKRLYPGAYNPKWMDLPETKDADGKYIFP